MTKQKPLTIIKRSGEREQNFSPRKFHASILKEALALKIPPGQAEEIAKLTTDHVEKWTKSRPTVTTADIRRVATRHLKRLHLDLAYLYENNGHMI
ncbi:hypothetical protein FWD07_02660 [Candidatus Saccharibacteria bacterium]|nr:hypothetical protein [Candidatus Saccharibacteria bacterium]